MNKDKIDEAFGMAAFNRVQFLELENKALRDRLASLEKVANELLVAARSVTKEVHPEARGMWPGMGDCFVKLREAINKFSEWQEAGKSTNPAKEGE